ncbi:glycoside hydrolase family 27 protein [Microbulbifer halophilus]|nr:glycoside hydrolase family 27 protein [Microbulbifer halophilus]MCW8126422.1 glycoside hydrolase family 27 protein [Microbulbifer halophilus]
MLFLIGREKIRGFSAIGLMLVAVAVHAEKFQGVADTPQMGWNSWNHFGCNIDEQIIRDMADAMVESGMKDAGYEYINIDDCWHGERDEQGFIQPHAEHFPSGMKALADYVHSRGLKLGIYSDAGATTCAGRPGSRGYEYQDALTYARWGIDYLKYDWCDTENLDPEGAYTTMRDALHAAGRPMLFSICEWGDNRPWEWAEDIGHSWRTTGDIYPCWNCELGHGSWSSWGVLPILDQQDGLRQHAGPGHWNDMDMLEVGNGMNAQEDIAHFSIWAMLTSPLIAGNDLRKMSRQTRDILTNEAVIAVNQDSLGIQAMKFIDEGDFEVWVKPLEEGDWAFMFLNRADSDIRYRYDWKAHRVEDDISDHALDFKRESFAWQGLWTEASGDTRSPSELEVPAHGVRLLRLTPM